MKNKKRHNPFWRLFILTAAFLFIAAASALGMFYYMFGITEPEGISLASWPHTFTENFSVWMENDKGNLKITETGLNRLDEYGLWLQVIDEIGQEVFCHNKPDTFKSGYSASELLSLSTSTYKDGYTVFVNSYEDAGQTWSYLIGFPYAIGKTMIYYNGENVGHLLPVFRTGIRFILCAAFVLVICYGFWLIKHLGRITKGIEDISLRTYIPVPERGVFSDIYHALNEMNQDISRSDRLKENTERARREWITNITHDLKTPLSPIKGYGEMLTLSPPPDKADIQEYGRIILKNIHHTEKLINDLKLTYQLDSGEAPWHPRPVRLVRFLKELVIDIVNDPAFTGRDIGFESHTNELSVSLDGDLFRRAVSNIIINALTHNPPETKVTVRVHADCENGVNILICDNGTGMSADDLSRLWDRYYRGTNTKAKPEGSGLGLAIAKQIIALHNGEITVKSKPDSGTQFTIFIPLLT